MGIGSKSDLGVELVYWKKATWESYCGFKFPLSVPVISHTNHSVIIHELACPAAYFLQGERYQTDSCLVFTSQISLPKVSSKNHTNICVFESEKEHVYTPETNTAL